MFNLFKKKEESRKRVELHLFTTVNQCSKEYILTRVVKESTTKADVTRSLQNLSFVMVDNGSLINLALVRNIEIVFEVY